MPISCLSQSYIAEVTQAFKVFDEDRAGSISIHSFKMLIRALGFRATKYEVMQEVYNAKKIQGLIDDDENDINLDIALDVMASKYSQRDPAVEMKMNFRLFDVNGDGFITLDDLKRAVSDMNKQCEEMGLETHTSLGEDQLKAMIEEFDGDLDGMISQEDFCRIMQPS
mmetsp:Transcript_21219/g.25253  ORF Transcript_21219/g.25253 Transcript_21219/m.25253 type:complete len:168 (-) Transcript_21219:264-767(-)|eukprot:CAMPEP_0198265284 /NCGR_PEP_ID=MMETSP1447-20131203/21543_1 /TAXON_ID=420782 /ORGANISM="Chaetoceros dichaeta, Strain CCMP1751" /LENGTH=167 /DNA_ID=CAMNT_0043954683 /DNA_START=69 /DNA_END=575 /DNA_ORIENTATION=+